MTGTLLENVPEPTPIPTRPARSPSGVGDSVLPPLALGLLNCGGVGALLFSVTYLVEGFTQPGYDAWQQPISALSLGPGGWVQQVNFVVFGVLMLLSAAGWYRFLTPERGAIWFPVLQVISGLCLIGVGVFSQGTLHLILAWALFLALAQGCFTLAAFFARAPHWRGWAVYSCVTGALILIFWGAFLKYETEPFAGLVERVSAGSHALWLCLLTATVLVQQRMRSG